MERLTPWSALVLMLVSCGGPIASAPGAARLDPPAAPLEPAEASRAPRARPARLIDSSSGFCAVDVSGAVRCWGAGWHYDLRPRAVPGLTDAVELVAARGVVCARRATGRVTCFAPHDGDFTTVEVDLADAIDLAAEHNELCAVRASGRIACWAGAYGLTAGWRDREGGSYFGDADGWTAITERAGIHDAVALRAGNMGSRAPHGCWCALRRSGRVSCWGRCGLAGEPEASDDGPATFELEDLDDVADLALGSERECVLRRTGGVLCTGEAHPDAQPPRLIVVRPTEGHVERPPDGWHAIPDTGSIVELEWRSRASGTSCGRTERGERRCWHDDGDVWDLEVDEDDPQLDDPQLDDPQLDEYERAMIASERAARMPGALASVADEIVATEEGGCARLREGEVRCWGAVEDGLGRTDVVSTPRRLEGIGGAVSLAVHEEVSCAVDASARVLCWGENNGGALGAEDGARSSYSTPHHVRELDTAVRVLVHASSVCVQTRSGEVRCRGEVARSSEDDEWPIEATRTFRALRGASSLALAYSTLCGIRGGRIHCHDADHTYDDVNGRSVRRLVERDFVVEGVERAVELHLTNRGVWIARTEDDRLAWFRADPDEPRVEWAPAPSGTLVVAFGRLCAHDGGTFSCLERPDGRGEPVPDLEIGPLAQLSASGHHACGVRPDGRVVCWGFNAYGELGRLPIAQRHSPAVVDALPEVRHVAAAPEHTCAIAASGDVYCFGRDEDGRLGVLRARERPRVRTVPEVE